MSKNTKHEGDTHIIVSIVSFLCITTLPGSMPSGKYS